MSRVKGWLGEKYTTFGLFLLLDNKIYSRFHDVVVPTDNGTTQIDHIIVSRFGLFVVETKNYSGWIYGDEKQSQWTQKFHNKEYPFQNPIRQNYRHQKCLAEYLDLEMSKIHPIVFFIGDCVLKTEMPESVMNKGIVSYIHSFKDLLISEEENLDISAKVGSLEKDATLNHKMHMESLKERHESTTVCLKCGSKLVERTVKQGARIGGGNFGMFCL